MIDISNPVPVFDDNHNVVAFKYNDGLIIHDCLTNTLNVSYIIINDLMVKTKLLDDVLHELKQYFGTFSGVKCHDRDLLLDLIKDLVMKVDEEKYPNSIFWFTKYGNFMMEYDKKIEYFWLSYDRMWVVLESEYGYNYNQINDLCTAILSDHFKLKVVTTFYEVFIFII